MSLVFWGGREWIIVYTRPPKQPKVAKVEPRIDRLYFDYGLARKEHAWLLRCEGMTLRRIGLRLGVRQERARQLIWIFGRRVSRALVALRPELFAVLRGETAEDVVAVFPAEREDAIAHNNRAARAFTELRGPRGFVRQPRVAGPTGRLVGDAGAVWSAPVRPVRGAEC